MAVLLKFHDLTFFVITMVFAVTAGLLAVPTAYFLPGLFAIAAAYVYCGFKQDEAQASEIRQQALRLGEEGLTYTDWLGRSMSLRWDRLRRVAFARCQPDFPDPWVGDCLEEFWCLIDVADKRIEVPIDFDRERALLAAFRTRLPLFNAALAERAIGCREAGHWLCWERPQAAVPGEASSPRRGS